VCVKTTFFVLSFCSIPSWKAATNLPRQALDKDNEGFKQRPFFDRF
jgi:hypothetical protein